MLEMVYSVADLYVDERPSREKHVAAATTADAVKEENVDADIDT